MSQYSNKQIRDFLVEFFANEDEEFEFFCDDHYAEVKVMFEAGMSAKKRAHLLTQHCAETNTFERLLTLLKETYPDKYSQTGLPIGQAEAQAPSPTPAVKRSDKQEISENAPIHPEPAQRPTGQAVFISYSRRDEPFIKQLYQALAGRGLSAWYDRFNIEVGNQWPEEIVTGIRDCQVFLLVLSPDSAGSSNVRKEVDLAQRYNKRIIPLIWRKVEIPVAMEYQLAGIQWIEFNEEATAQKLDQLAAVIRRLIGGDSMGEATSDTAIAKESTVPELAAAPSAEKSSGGRRLLKGLQFKSETINPVAIGGQVIAGVVTTFGLSVDDQDFVNDELKWLFYAANHLLKIYLGEVQPDQPIPVAIPPNAERLHQADNRVQDLSLISTSAATIEKKFERIRGYLSNLDLTLKRVVQLEAGQTNIDLQNILRSQRFTIVEELRDLAVMMKQVYGVGVTGPDQLTQLLGS